MKKTYLLGLLAALAVAIPMQACGGSDKSGDGDSGDGDTGDGDTGDGDTGDGDIGDGDAASGGSDGNTGGSENMGGDTSTGGMAMGGQGGMTATGGMASTDGTCTGTADVCADQSQASCITAGCALSQECTGETGCDDNDTALECNADLKDCSWTITCSGTVDACGDQADDLSCGMIDGCTWEAN